MTDTVRTLSALQTLLADNTSGAISPQDLRDAVISSVGFAYATAISANTTLDNDDVVVLGTSGSGGITVTLPAAASSSHKIYAIKKVDSGAGALTIDGNDSETIDGSTTHALSSQYDGVIIACDGSEWHILASI